MDIEKQREIIRLWNRMRRVEGRRFVLPDGSTRHSSAKEH